MEQGRRGRPSRVSEPCAPVERRTPQGPAGRPGARPRRQSPGWSRSGSSGITTAPVSVHSAAARYAPRPTLLSRRSRVSARCSTSRMTDMPTEPTFSPTRTASGCAAPASSTCGSTTTRSSTSADGRLLLRGTNGAGKSKTLEMLLPFATRRRQGADHRVGPTPHQPALADDRRLRRAGPSGLRLGRVPPSRPSGDGRRLHLWRRYPGVGVGQDRHRVVLRDKSARRPRPDPRGRRRTAARPRLEEASSTRRGQVFDRHVAYKEHVGRSCSASTGQVRRGAPAALLAAPAPGRGGHRTQRAWPTSSRRPFHSSTSRPCEPPATRSTS